MCFDDETNTIYVFGGRVLMNSHHQEDNHSTEFSGLYSYEVDRDRWTLLREDSGNAGPEDIRSRIGHSMLLDSVCFDVSNMYYHLYIKHQIFLTSNLFEFDVYSLVYVIIY